MEGVPHVTLGMTMWRPCQYPPLDRDPCEAGGAPLEGGDGLIRCMTGAAMSLNCTLGWLSFPRHSPICEVAHL